MSQTKIVDLFPTPIYLSKCELDISQEIDYLKSLDLDILDPTVITNYGCRSVSTHVLHDINLKKLKNYIIDCLEDYVTNVLNYKIKEMVLTQSWVSIKQPGQKHVAHSHPNSFISGVFYWQHDICPLVFVNDKNKMNFVIPKKDMVPANDPTDDEFPLFPIERGLVLFPSNLHHFVPTNNSNLSRYSLAFNSVPIYIGVEEHLCELDFLNLARKNDDNRI